MSVYSQSISVYTTAIHHKAWESRHKYREILMLLVSFHSLVHKGKCIVNDYNIPLFRVLSSIICLFFVSCRFTCFWDTWRLRTAWVFLSRSPSSHPWWDWRRPSLSVAGSEAMPERSPSPRQAPLNMELRRKKTHIQTGLHITENWDTVHNDMVLYTSLSSLCNCIMH